MEALQAVQMQQYDPAAFSRLLHVSMDDVFTLDLSEYNLVQCVEKMCKVKEKSHPKMARNYSMAVYQLKLLQDEFGCIVEPKRITGIFWNMFISWMAARGIKYSSIKTIKCQILSTLNWASKYGARLHPSFDEVEVPKYRAAKIALTPAEVAHIYYLDLSRLSTTSERYGREIKMRSDKIRTLTRVKDHFVLASNLGQRHSDMVRLKPEYFNDMKLSMIQQKTGNRCIVDIAQMSMDKRITKEILERYDYRAPYPYDVTNYNKYLHELLQIAGHEFNETIRIENKINGMIITEEKKKWQLVGSHTARRSFATYNELRGKLRHDTMKATGHTTESSFIKYICDDEDLY